MTSAFLDPFSGAPGIAYELEETPPPMDWGKTCGYLAKESQWRRGVSILNRPKILCINGDPLLLATIAELLLAHDFQVLLACDGPSGIQTAKQGRPDLILLDVALSQMSGFDVCRRLRDDPDLRQVPIILMMALDDPELALKGMEAGATRALHWPYSSTYLTEAVLATLVSTAEGRTAGMPLSDEDSQEDDFPGPLVC